MIDKDLIKDVNLIVEQKIDDKNNCCTYILKNTSIDNKLVKLSDVFNYLPSGLIHKTETGMGATTLEINSNRNSIIVEPIKITASSKAYFHKNDRNTFYCGSPTKYHKNRVTKKDIKAYLADTNIVYKKFIVVADSLPNLINEIGDDNLQSYFLLIDEIDSFQIDSSYRSNMEVCIDIYKNKFSSSNKAMVSATLLDFSDKELKKEYKTKISYKTQEKRNVTITTGDFVEAEALLKIGQIFSKYPNEKIFIAYNSVNGCYDLAEACKKFLPQRDIKILCSIKNNEKKIGVRDYLHELNDTLLPAKINFATSAYFTGFDIDEPYHLIIISSITNIYTPISENRIVQIAGRCRKKLSSINIIHDYNFYKPSNKITLRRIEEFIAAAEAEKTALNCIESNFNDNALLKQHILDIRKAFVSAVKVDEFKLVWINSDGKAEISYLNVDSCWEAQRVTRTLYNGKFMLSNVLKKLNFNVTRKDGTCDEPIENSNISKIDREKRIKDVLDNLSTLTDKNIISNLSWYHDLDRIQKSIADAYEDARYYIDNGSLMGWFTETLIDKYSITNFNTLKMRLRFAIANKDDFYKKTVIDSFKLNEKYTQEELIEKWTEITKKMGWQISISKTKVVDITKLHFQTVRAKKTINNVRENAEKIVSFCPLDLEPFDFKEKNKELDYRVFCLQMG